MLYVGRIESEVDPRLAAQDAGAASLADGLDGLAGDSMGDVLLDRAKITLDLQWAVGEDGERRLSYRFNAVSATTPRPGVYRQPRQPSAPAAE